MALQSVSDATFEAEVLQSDLPVLVDFYADWCGPCKTLAPVLESFQAKYGSGMKFVKVDIERNPGLAQAFRIQSIPTLAFVNEGRIVDVAVGAPARDQLEAKIKDLAKPSTTASAETWDAQRLKLGIEAGMVTAVDLRAPSDYARAHLPSALNIPQDELADRLDELKGGAAKYAFYARTSEGVGETVKPAVDAGIRTIILDGGILAWEVESLPIERGEA